MAETTVRTQLSHALFNATAAYVRLRESSYSKPGPMRFNSSSAAHHTQTRNAMTHGSLFAGIGGFDLGFERAGIETVWQVEIEEFCLKVLERHFPNAKRFKDIREVGAHNLEKVDIISGGFPCTDISIAGKKAGITGKQSGLWSEMFRVIGELRPRFAVIENVPNLVKLGLDRVLIDLASIGYDAEWQIISARDLGAWHLRKRIWIVAYPQGDGYRQVQYKCTKKLLYKNKETQKFKGGCRNVSNADKIHDDNPGYGTSKVCGKRQEKTEIQKHISDSGNKRIREHKRETKENQSISRSGLNQRIREAFDEGRERWAVEPQLDRLVDGISHRVDQLKGLGNAIVPQIAEIIGKLIMESTSVNPHT